MSQPQETTLQPQQPITTTTPTQPWETMTQLDNQPQPQKSNDRNNATAETTIDGMQRCHCPG